MGLKYYFYVFYKRTKSAHILDRIWIRASPKKFIATHNKSLSSNDPLAVPWPNIVFQKWFLPLLQNQGTKRHNLEGRSVVLRPANTPRHRWDHRCLRGSTAHRATSPCPQGTTATISQTPCAWKWLTIQSKLFADAPVANRWNTVGGELIRKRHV
jgi:hypothetical protein